MLAIKKKKCPAYPEYEDYEKRLRTFEGFNIIYSDYPPEQFAKSGFFWTQHADIVRCYCCDLTLKDWLPQDDPIREHARFSPLCKHILTKVPGITYKYKGKGVDIPGTPKLYDEQKKEPTAPTLEEYSEESSLFQRGKDMGRVMNEAMNIPSAPPVPTPAPRVVAKNHMLVSNQPPIASSTVDNKASEHGNISHVQNCIDRAMKCVSEMKTVVTNKITEVEEIKEKALCIQCRKTLKNVMFLPCQHLYYCSNCVDDSANMCVCQRTISRVLVASE